MPFFNYDRGKWPLVKVTLNGNIESDEDFNVFLHAWNNLYLHEQNFTLLFDARNFGMISIKYAIKMTFFIKKIKKNKPQFLSKSLILLKGRWLRFLVSFMFSIEKPVAPVYVYYTDNDDTNDVYYYHEKILSSPEDFSRFYPKPLNDL
tara:strand:- start:9127 stop:9570 length:444 start_codon:yes stop_codon:yes gene_type:complete